MLDVPQSHRPNVYTHAPVVCRADNHVVWRGDALPSAHDAADMLEAKLCGLAVGSDASSSRD